MLAAGWSPNNRPYWPRLTPHRHTPAHARATPGPVIVRGRIVGVGWRSVIVRRRIRIGLGHDHALHRRANTRTLRRAALFWSLNALLRREVNEKADLPLGDLAEPVPA